jgi:hypothetical protein
MKIIRIKSVPVSIVMTILVLLPSVPCPPAQAALIDTEAALNSLHPQNDRQLVKTFLARTDVQNALIAQGIDPTEAQMRADSLTDEEISAIKENIVNLPAGGEVLGLVILVLVIVLLVVVVMRLK